MIDSERDSPKIEVTMPQHRFVIMELAAAGFGSPEILMNERVDLVLDAYEYHRFKRKYEYQSFLIRERKNANRGAVL